MSATGCGNRHFAAPPSLPDLAYTIHGKLWLGSVQGHRTWHLTTPWPISDLTWPPDGHAIAFHGKRGMGVAVLEGHTGHTVFAERLPQCCYNEIGWSPNSRYFAFSVNAKIDAPATLWLWDRATRHVRLLLHGLSPDYPYGSWAYDSTRIAVATGTGMPTFNTKGNPVAEILDIRSGRITRLGKGVPGAWSPDDLFIGFNHWWVCGATGCFVQEDIISSSGGKPTVLDHYIREGRLTDEEWLALRHGYAYDRWLIGPHGGIRRQLVPLRLERLDQVESWSPSGLWVTARFLTPSRRIVLTLTNRDTDRSRKVYASPPTGECDACMNQGYELMWNSASTAFVMLTPYVGGAPVKDVKPSLYLYTLKSGHLSKGIRMADPYPALLGWVDHDRAVIVYSGHALFRYTPGHKHLIPIVHGLRDSSDEGTLGSGSTAELRPGD